MLNETAKSETAKSETAISDDVRDKRNRMGSVAQRLPCLITFLEQMLYDARSVSQKGDVAQGLRCPMELAIENLEKTFATERERWNKANNKLAALIDQLRRELAEAHDVRIAAMEARDVSLAELAEERSARIAAEKKSLAAKPITTAEFSIEFYKLPPLNSDHDNGTLFVPLPKALQVPIPVRPSTPGEAAGEKHVACCCEVCKFFDTHQQEREACGYVPSWDTLVINLGRRIPGQSIAAGRTTTCHFPAINSEYLSLLPSEVVRAAFASFV